MHGQSNRPDLEIRNTVCFLRIELPARILDQPGDGTAGHFIKAFTA
jgi:hypothetical protein